MFFFYKTDQYSKHIASATLSKRDDRIDDDEAEDLETDEVNNDASFDFFHKYLLTFLWLQ